MKLFTVPKIYALWCMFFMVRLHAADVEVTTAHCFWHLAPKILAPLTLKVGVPGFTHEQGLIGIATVENSTLKGLCVGYRARNAAETYQWGLLSGFYRKSGEGFGKGSRLHVGFEYDTPLITASVNLYSFYAGLEAILKSKNHKPEGAGPYTANGIDAQLQFKLSQWLSKRDAVDLVLGFCCYEGKNVLETPSATASEHYSGRIFAGLQGHLMPGVRLRCGSAYLLTESNTFFKKFRPALEVRICGSFFGRRARSQFKPFRAFTFHEQAFVRWPTFSEEVYCGAQASGSSEFCTMLSWGVAAIVGGLIPSIMQAMAMDHLKESMIGKTGELATSLEQTEITFDDVAGYSEAKRVLQEAVSFLQNPDRFSEIGATPIKGILLEGPPGVGKTLLAKALATEARVPFLTTSGSAFSDIFSGVCPGRVKQLFGQARREAPCIVFIDEIDAVAAARSSSGSSDDEKTLVQFLVEMDGFESSRKILVIAATNRAEVLDPAILRPGRFDRRVTLPLPSLSERQAILALHARTLKIDPSVDFSRYARLSTGFSGADLKNLINEAALNAVNQGRPVIMNQDFDQARERLLVGFQTPSVVLSEADRKRAACREAGHVVVAGHLPNADGVYSVTLMPCGKKLGSTSYLSEREPGFEEQRDLENRISICYAGYLAEKLCYDTEALSSASSEEIGEATTLAWRIVTAYGLGSADVPMAHLESQHLSEKEKEVREHKVREILKRCYLRAETLLHTHQVTFQAVREALLQHETLDAAAVAALLKSSP